MKYAIINYQTGEILEDINIDEVMSIKNKMQQQAVDKMFSSVEYNKGSNFIKIFHQEWTKVFTEVVKSKKYSTLAVVSTLIPFIEFNSNVLKINKKRFSVSDLSRVMGISRKQANIYFDNLLELKIISKLNSNQGYSYFGFNPNLIMNGTRVAKELVSLYGSPSNNRLKHINELQNYIQDLNKKE